MADPINVLVLHNIMAPYRFPLFKELSNIDGIDLTVWFMSESAKNRIWQLPSHDLGFKYKVLRSIQLSYYTRDLFTYIFNYSFPWKYMRHDFDVLVAAGWLDFACQTGLVLSKVMHRKFVLWSESTAYEPSWRRSAARPLVRTIVRGSDAYIAAGTRAKAYLLEMGAAPTRVFTAFSTVDVEHYMRVGRQRATHREALKLELGIHRRRVILYCGQLIERKGVRHLLQAFALVKLRFEDVALVFVGYGPLRQELEARVAATGVRDVHFLGPLDIEALPDAYAVADIFVLPSLEETWGLVVNEAMAFGLPVIVTDRVGASVDLVRNNENGFVVPAGASVGLADAFYRLLADDALLERLSAGSLRRIGQFTPRAAASVFATAVRQVARHKQSA